jgi:AraC-like DNA-binding protein
VLDEIQQWYWGRGEKLIRIACRKIEQEMQDPQSAQNISISRIAAALGISSGHLGRLFKKIQGVTFEQHLMQVRVEAAKRKLLQPLDSVAQVSELCGFKDPTYFSRVFRKIAGCSPTDYRNNPLHPAVHSDAQS